jgi:hypothetical protein
LTHQLGIIVLDSTDDVRALGSALIAEGPIPPQAAIDALHIAIAAVNGMEYLLTWNCTHIANAVMRPRIEVVCRTFRPLLGSNASVATCLPAPVEHGRAIPARAVVASLGSCP